jgi:hypothetical protein
MKTKALAFSLVFSALALCLPAQAHDPKEHMKNTEKPNCSAMKNMEHSKMDMDDAVMQAMMKQCMRDMHDAENDEDVSHDDNKKVSNDQNSKHQH